MGVEELAVGLAGWEDPNLKTEPGSVPFDAKLNDVGVELILKLNVGLAGVIAAGGAGEAAVLLLAPVNLKTEEGSAVEFVPNEKPVVGTVNVVLVALGAGILGLGKLNLKPVVAPFVLVEALSAGVLLLLAGLLLNPKIDAGSGLGVPGAGEADPLPVPKSGLGFSSPVDDVVPELKIGLTGSVIVVVVVVLASKGLENKPARGFESMAGDAVLLRSSSSFLLFSCSSAVFFASSSAFFLADSSASFLADSSAFFLASTSALLFSSSTRRRSSALRFSSSSCLRFLSASNRNCSWRRRSRSSASALSLACRCRSSSFKRA